MPRALIQAEVELEYWLVLNLMRDKAQSQRGFGPFPSKEAALAYHDGELVEPWTDEGPNGFDGTIQTYTKRFRKGSELEWMNPLEQSERDVPGTFGHGIYERFGDTYNVQILQRF
jgi:hypothetical protein